MRTVFLSTFTFMVPLCCLTLYHTIPTFNDPAKEALENRGKTRKMLVTSNFSFSHNYFYPCIDKFQFFNYNYFVVSKYFQFGQIYKICRLVRSQSTFDKLTLVLRISSRRNMDERRGRGAAKRFKP